MTYEVVLSKDAENDLDNFIQYLLFEKHSKQAAANVLQDFENTKRSLEKIASSLKLCDNPRLESLGYHRSWDIEELILKDIDILCYIEYKENVL